MTEEGSKLAKLIKKAITDLELTTSEYQEILAQANADGMIDPDEKMLLAQLHQMIANGTIDRVPG
jgi:hypothetical protein